MKQYKNSMQNAVLVMQNDKIRMQNDDMGLQKAFGLLQKYSASTNINSA